MLYLDVFNREYINRTPITGIVHPTDLSYLRRLYIFNKDAIERYYQERNFAVKNTHILSRILEHFPTYIQYDTFRYIDYALDKLKYLAKHFQFTSDMEKGVVHPGNFFGNENEEIIISSYELFNVTELTQNWKQAKTVYTLAHNRNDHKLLLPLGTDDQSKSGLCSIMINIPKLAIQYREFNKQQARHEAGQVEDGSLVLNKNHFVIKYVISNMMDDVIDHMFLNKVMDKFYGIETQVPKFKHRFKIFEPNTQIDRYVDQTLDVITTKSLDFINILHNIHLMFKIDASELLALPNIGYTNNIKWALFISRLDYMIFLFNVAKNKTTNKHYLNDWARLAKRLLRDNRLNDMFSYTTEKDIKEKLYKISNM